MPGMDIRPQEARSDLFSLTILGKMFAEIKAVVFRLIYGNEPAKMALRRQFMKPGAYKSQRFANPLFF